MPFPIDFDRRPYNTLALPCYSSPYATGTLSRLSVCPVCNVGILWPNGWMDQDATWCGGSLGPGGIVFDGDRAVPNGNWHIGPPHISAHFALARSPISATAELLLRYASGQTNTRIFRHGHHNTSQCYQGGEWGRSKNKQGINITYFCVSESCRYWRSL